MISVRDLPNILTVARMLLVGPLVYMLLTERYVAALVLALVAGISDWLDGALARRFNWQSQFGGILDPLADKLLMLASYATLTWLDALPVWLLALVVARDLIIVAGGMVYHYWFESFQAQPTQLSKYNTLCQLVLVWVVLTTLAGLPVPQWLSVALVWLVALMAVATLVQYVFKWGRRAVRIAHTRDLSR
ncbi:MAG: CDP-alcohol phosphatidyltransferase family protein [Wenzhouxiangellaceae bacterium]|nr:CDP-alcohol phosphatidyltransferase family protein [Wenzhouxiangellaceae bacterium]